MAFMKQAVAINFQKGLDTKTDPYQVQLGNFLRLENMIFTTGDRFTKRNGYGKLTALPEFASHITTFNGNLTAIGTNLQAYIAGTQSWINKGQLQPIEVNTLSIIRNNSNQVQVDAVVSSTNLVCAVYTQDSNYYYVVADSVTGQNVLPPAFIPTSGVLTTAPRVFLLGNFFVLVFGSVISSVNHLPYVAINNVNPVAPTSAVDLSTQFTPSASLAYDGTVANDTLYLAWNGSDIGGAIRISSLSATLVQANTIN